jgi:hypothetical protein
VSLPIEIQNYQVDSKILVPLDRHEDGDTETGNAGRQFLRCVGRRKLWLCGVETRRSVRLAAGANKKKGQTRALDREVVGQKYSGRSFAILQECSL